MRFLIFNLVVGTALGYLLLWDGPRPSPDRGDVSTVDARRTEGLARGEGAAPMAGTHAGGRASERASGPVSRNVSLAAEGPAERVLTPDVAPDSAPGSGPGSMPDTALDAASDPADGGAGVGADDRAVDRAVDPRSAWAPESDDGFGDASADRPAPRDLGQRLHDLARDMESRFLTGIR